MLQDTTLLSEIHGLNRSYLSLLQRSLREDFAAATRGFELSAEVGQVLVQCSPERLDKLARTPQLLLRFHFNDVQFLQALGAKIAPGASSEVQPDDALSAHRRRERAIGAPY